MEIKKEVSLRPLQIDYRSCKLCPYRTKSMFLLIGHLRLHRLRTSEDSFGCHSNPPQDYKCNKCSFETDLKTTLQHHIDTAHKTASKPEEVVKTYKCQGCGLETCSLLVFSRHFYSATNDETCGLFACSLCPYTTTSRCYFTAHSIVRHQQVRRSEWYECEQCSSFATKKKLAFVDHTANEHADPQDRARLRCPHCPFQTYLKDYLNNHILDDHPDPEGMDRFECDQCPGVFKGRNVLDGHIMAVHGYKGQKCPHCPYRCVSKRELRLHINCKHARPEEVKWFECEHCSFKTKTNSNLGRHVKIKHESEKINWYACERCTFKTTLKWSLGNHMNVHHSKPEEVKWLECDKCGLRSKSKYTFRKHKFRCRVAVV